MPPLRILLPIKRVLDYAIKPRISAGALNLAGLKQSLNPFDELSIEASLRLRETLPKDSVPDILALTIGPAKSADALRTAMAMGADRAFHITSDADVPPLTVAKLLAKAVKQEDANLVILGKQAIDNDAGQTGQMLAGLLGWGQATQACEIRVEGEELVVVKEVDGGTETVRGKLPMVVTTDLRLNEPRYASLPGIMKAKKKKLVTVGLEAFAEGVEVGERVRVVKVEEPGKREGGGKVADVPELVKKLKELGAL